MPRKVIVTSFRDQLIRYCMTAPIVEVKEALQTATQIVIVRADGQAEAAAGKPAPRKSATRPGTEQPAGAGLRAVPPAAKQHALDQAKDAAAAMNRTNSGAGGAGKPQAPKPPKPPKPPVAKTTKGSGPKNPPPPIVAPGAQAPAAPAAPPAEPLVPEQLPPQEPVEE